VKFSPGNGSRFAGVLERLESWHSDAVMRLKNGDRSALALKLEVEDAMQCLLVCRTHGITSKAKVTEIPETLTRTPGSEYRVMEDHETDDRQTWTALMIGRAELRPSPGMLLIDCGRWPAQD
jgi:hypothetical protein